MQVVNWAVFIAFAAAWLWVTVRLLQWRDLHADRARARQDPMGPGTWVKTNAIAGIHPTWIWGIFAIGLAALAWLVWQAPYAVSGAASLAVMVSGWRQTEPEPNDIQDLRRALGKIIGLDAKEQPPKVTPIGEHEAGGPLQLHVQPIEGWEFWKDGKWKDMERAIEYRIDGDWANVKKSAVEGLVWERLPMLPTKVDYPGPIPGGTWRKLAVGPNGVDGYAYLDFTEETGRAHWLLIGDNGEGKTTLLGSLGTQLLDHRADVEVALFDVKGIGLKRFAGREGVVYEALGDYELIEAGLAWLNRELYERKALAMQGKWRKPLIVLWDELAETFSDALAIGKRIGVKADGQPKTTGPLQIEQHAISLGRLGREYGIHLVCADQRADGESVPVKFRAQLKGRIALGRFIDQKAAEMAVGTADAPRLLNMEAAKGRCTVKGLQWVGYAHSFWLANPYGKTASDQERRDAELLLPPMRPVRVSDTGDVTLPETAESARIDSKHKREPAVGTTGDITGGVGVTRDISVETPLERMRRQRRKASAKWRGNVPKRLLDPSDSIHGTKTGRAAGCLCEPCKTLTPRAKVMA